MLFKSIKDKSIIICYLVGAKVLTNTLLTLNRERLTKEVNTKIFSEYKLSIEMSTELIEFWQ